MYRLKFYFGFLIMLSDEERTKQILKNLKDCNLKDEKRNILMGVYDSDLLMKNISMQYIKDQEFILESERSNETLKLLKEANRRSIIAILVSFTSVIIALVSYWKV
jgi:hypothetical protein